MTAFGRAVNSIGKKDFIDYYEDFRSRTDKNVLKQKLLANNKEKEALTIIINSELLDDGTKKKSREYFNIL